MTKDLSLGYLSEYRDRPQPPGELSARERHCLLLVSHGLQQKEIAALLHIERETVKTLLKRAQKKLQAKSAAHAACQALRAGLID